MNTAMCPPALRMKTSVVRLHCPKRRRSLSDRSQRSGHRETMKLNCPSFHPQPEGLRSVHQIEDPKTGLPRPVETNLLPSGETAML